MDNKYFSDGQFKRVLEKETWYTINSVNTGLTFLDLSNIGKDKNSLNELPYTYFTIYNFNHDGSFKHQLIDKTSRFRNNYPIDSIGAIKFSNSTWEVKDKKLYIKTDITMNSYNTEEKVMYQCVTAVDNVYNINIRMSKPISEMRIDLVLIREESKSWYKQYYKRLN